MLNMPIAFDFSDVSVNFIFRSLDKRKDGGIVHNVSSKLAKYAIPLYSLDDPTSSEPRRPWIYDRTTQTSIRQYRSLIFHGTDGLSIVDSPSLNLHGSHLMKSERGSIIYRSRRQEC